MIKKVIDAITRFDMLKGAKNVTVALSGGADSMALLCALSELKEDLSLEKITAAHFNHKIRGEEALRDQSFVERYCKEKGIKCFVGNADVPQFAKQNNLSLELAARQLRYEFFESLDTDLIATAHTASDNIETVLFNITRGTALSGLCGIPPVRGKYIRPLILCTRSEIESYCEQKGVEYVTDSTNLCDDYTRNKLRHNVVPVLKAINESVENAASRMTIALREDEDFISGIVTQKYCDMLCENGLSLDEFATLHTAVAKRIIARFCADNDIDADNFHINSIYDICLCGGKISLPQNKSAVANNKILKFESADFKPENIRFDVNISRCDNTFFENDKKIHNLLLKNIIDCDKIEGTLRLRTRQSGDTIRLKNKNCTKTLKKLFCEYKIPLEERENLPVLCDDHGIVWVHKIGVAERSAADENSVQVYKIDVQKL